MYPATAALLVCPLCHGPFDWLEIRREGAEIESARIRCPACGIRASVREGLGYFLPGDAHEDSPGNVGETASTVGRIVGEDRSPALSPGPWSPTTGRPSDWLVGGSPMPSGPILELGPGSGEASAHFARRKMGHPVVVEGEAERLAERRGSPIGRVGWDGLVADPHSLPFADRSIGVAVSELGLQNTPGAFVTLRELRRVVSGELRAVASFVTEVEAPDRRWLREAGVEEAFDEGRCLESFRRAHWEVAFEPKIEAMLPAAPATPDGPDGFPHSPVRIRWGLLRAR